MDSQPFDSSVLTYPQLQVLLRIEFARARRYDYALSCLVLEVDRLDHLCDLYGSEVKTEILASVVRLVRSHARSSDGVAVSGDRVTAVLPHTDREGAVTLSNRMHRKVGELALQHGDKEITISVSVGVATCDDRNHIFFDSLLKNAEQALFSMIQRGGNGVELFQVPGAVVERVPEPTSPSESNRSSA